MKSFQTVDDGQAWFGYWRVACRWGGCMYFGFMTQSAGCVPALLEMSASEETWR
jgi:hypothetical protein